jgi:hypothetical protein
MNVNELDISSKHDAIHSISFEMWRPIRQLSSMRSLAFSIAGALACEFETKSCSSLFRNSLQINKKVERFPDLTEKISSRPCDTDKDERQSLQRRDQDHRCALRTKRIVVAAGQGIGSMPNSSRRHTLRSNEDRPFESFKRELKL